MTNTPPKPDPKAFLPTLGLSMVVDIDKVFDKLPDCDSDLAPLAEPGDVQWRPVFLGPPGITISARYAAFATLSGLAPDSADEVLPDHPDMPPMPPQRDWAVMTFGFATRRAAAVAGMCWATALAQALECDLGEGLVFVGVDAFPPDWRGYS
jgi:hypothetical protein